MTPVVPPTVAVLTGDVVGSTQLNESQLDKLLAELTAQLNAIAAHHPHSTFELMRGDAFQLLVMDYQHAAHYALLIRMALKAHRFDCRISIGCGALNRRRETLGTSSGEAFLLSGRGLDRMKNERLKIASSVADFSYHFDLLTEFLDHQVTQMTDRQSAIGYLKLCYPHWRQSDIADKLAVNRVSVTRSLKAARFDLIERYLADYYQQTKEYYPWS